MEYTTKQQEFLTAVEAGENIFLTGKAGTGKSTVVKAAIELLEKTKKVVALAPTGIAANNIGGQTIHSLFSLMPYGVLDYDKCNFVKGPKKLLYRKIEAIFIDEVSMLRPDTLDAIDWTLIKNGLPGLKKRQIIFIGDMKQLPPILDDNTRTILYQEYDGDTFEYSKIFQELKVRTIELDEVVRQTDGEFIHHLNFIREGKKSEYFRKFVSQEPSGIILAPHNATVNQYNLKGLTAQSGTEIKLTASIEGEVKVEDFTLEQEITVKDGCQIMYLVNSQENPLRNGTLGKFVCQDIKKKKFFIQVGNIDYALDKVMLTKKQYVYNKEKDKLELKELGSITQYPFKLAYALSIHKAQGLTFDEVTIDLTRPVFQKGQMYVALSRVRSPHGLKILI